MSDNTALLTLAEQLSFAIYSASNKVMQLYREPLKKLGLTYTQHIVILALFERPRLTSGQLATLLKLDPSSLTPIMTRLIKLGHVEQSFPQQDRRLRLYSLTDAGQTLRGDLRAIQVGIRASVSGSDATLDALREAVKSFTRGVSIKAKGHRNPNVVRRASPTTIGEFARF